MLSTVFSEEKTRSIIEVMPDEMIVWKVVTDPTFYRAEDLYNPTVWLSAFNKNHGRHRRFVGFPICTPLTSEAAIEGHGYHSFIKKNTAINYRRTRGHLTLISANIKKCDILKIGNDGGGLCVTTHFITVPTYPNTDITQELSEAPLIEECEEVMELMEVGT